METQLECLKHIKGKNRDKSKLFRADLVLQEDIHQWPRLLLFFLLCHPFCLASEFKVTVQTIGLISEFQARSGKKNERQKHPFPTSLFIPF